MKAGKLHGISVPDHLILGGSGAYMSFWEEGWILRMGDFSYVSNVLSRSGWLLPKAKIFHSISFRGLAEIHFGGYSPPFRGSGR